MTLQAIPAVPTGPRASAVLRPMVGHVLLGLLVASGALWVGLIGLARLAEAAA